MIYATLKTLHVLSIIVWIGGMVFAHFFLRPAVAQFERDAGTLMADVANRATPPTPQPQPVPQPEPEPEPGKKAPQRIERARLVKTDALQALADARTLLEGLGEVSVDIQIVIREQE